MRPSTITFQGVDYALGHLSPFVMSVTPKAPGAPTFRVLVSFGHHTFTREVQPGDDAAHHYAEMGDRRCFCPLRHGQSVNLPVLIQQSALGRAYFSLKHNFLFVENIPGLHGPYTIFFNIQKATGKGLDAAMFVVSAYEKLGLPPRNKLPAITFATLVSNVVNSKPIVRPKKK